MLKHLLFFIGLILFIVSLSGLVIARLPPETMTKAFAFTTPIKTPPPTPVTLTPMPVTPTLTLAAPTPTPTPAGLVTPTPLTPMPTPETPTFTPVTPTPTPETPTPTPMTPTPTPVTPTPTPVTPTPAEVTVTFQEGIEDYVGTEDTFLAKWAPTTNYGSDEVLQLAESAASLIKFDVSSIPSDAIINKATLSFYVLSGLEFQQVDVYEVFRPWQEGEATWLEAIEGVEWELAGCNGPTDRSSISISTMTLTLNEINTWAEFDVTSIVEAWVRGNNNGLILKASSSWWVKYSLASSEWPDPSLRPKLTVIYRPAMSSSLNDPAATSTPMPARIIKVKYPPRMSIGDSYIIKLSLLSIKGEIYTPTIEISRYTLEMATPEPVGTPDVPLEKQFGEQYDIVAASAKITAVNFECKPHDPEYQPISDKIIWRWGIEPKKPPGKREILLSLYLHWKPKDPELPEEVKQVWGTTLKISAQEPWLTRGQINILGTLGLIVVPALQIPWLLSRWKEWTERKKKQVETPSTSD